MHVINVHHACDTPVTRSAGPCDCPDLPGRSPAALQAPTDQFNNQHLLAEHGFKEGLVEEQDLGVVRLVHLPLA